MANKFLGFLTVLLNILYIINGMYGGLPTIDEELDEVILDIIDDSRNIMLFVDESHVNIQYLGIIKLLMTDFGINPIELKTIDEVYEHFNIETSTLIIPPIYNYTYTNDTINDMIHTLYATWNPDNDTNMEFMEFREYVYIFRNYPIQSNYII